MSEINWYKNKDEDTWTIEYRTEEMLVSIVCTDLDKALKKLKEITGDK